MAFYEAYCTVLMDIALLQVSSAVYSVHRQAFEPPTRQHVYKSIPDLIPWFSAITLKFAKFKLMMT